MDNKSELFLRNWIELCNQSGKGETPAPNFEGIGKAYSVSKKMPYYVFDDQSVMVLIIDRKGQVNYMPCDDVSELEREWEMGCTRHGCEYSVFNIFDEVDNTGNNAELFLKIWVNEYEQSKGEISKPDFSGIKRDYSDRKSIPHYAFNDLSVMIVIINQLGQTQYVVCDNAIELDHEWEMESDQLGFESAIVDIFSV